MNMRHSMLRGLLLVPIVAGLIATSLAIASRDDGIAPPIPIVSIGEAEAGGQSSGELRIVAATEKQDAIITAYQQQYPDRRIVWEHVDEDHFLDRLAQSPAPDMIIPASGLADEIVGLDLFEDMDQKPYEAGKLITQQWFKGLTLEPFKSLDGRSLIAIPKDYPMEGTFYRADIMAQYGLPSEPEALGAYMEDPQHWLKMAELLAAHGHGVFSYPPDVLNLAAAGLGYFDHEGKFTRNTHELASIASMMQQAVRENLASNWNMWDERGQQAIRDGGLVMLYMGEWGKDLIQQWDPEHAAQWRFTRLPFNAYAVHGGSFFSVMKSSSHKNEAWDYIQLCMNMEAPYQQSLTGHQWLASVPDYWPSPLDAQAEEIWSSKLKDAARDRTKDEYGAGLLQQIEQEVLGKLGNDVHVLTNITQAD